MKWGYVLSFCSLYASFYCDAAILGVDPVDIPRYSGKSFVCGKLTISSDKINDDFCDCPDGSDEPGTSACDNGSFACRNEGYKITRIPSSRVSDGVCDCCDGSDEPAGVCSNECDALAAATKKSLERAHAAYTVGSAIRAELIRSSEVKIADCKGQLEAVLPEFDRINGELVGLKATVEAEDSIERGEVAAMKTEVYRELGNLLQLNDMHESTLAPTLSILFSIVDLLEEDVSDLLAQISTTDTHTARVTEMAEEIVVDGVDFGDNVAPEHAYGYGYGEEGEADDSVVTTVVGDDDTETAHIQTQTVAYTAENCVLLAHSDDERLQPLCRALEGTHDLTLVRRFLAHLIITRSAGEDIQVLIGFQKVFGTLDGAKDYHKQLTATPLKENRERACPSDFQVFPDVCTIDGAIRELIASRDYRYHHRLEADTAREAVKASEAKLRDLEESKRNCENVLKEGEEFAGHLEFLALKDKCFDQKDANFVYSVCMLGKITQKENGRSNTVTLGNFGAPSTAIAPFDIVQGLASTPGLRLLYDKGTHCHAFGARSAEVIVSCGPENILSEASEPSTCFYSFKLESPAACTEEVARSIGL